MAGTKTAYISDSSPFASIYTPDKLTLSGGLALIWALVIFLKLDRVSS